MAEGKSVMVQGRIVWTSGDLFAGRVKTIFGTQTPKTNAQGEKQMEYGFGLAVRKDLLGDPVQGAIWQAMHDEAFTLFPNRMIPPSFAMKFKDGDGPDDQGKPFALREGYAGHLVFAMTTSLPIRFFRFENGQNIQINEGIKCGDYVEVQVNIVAHPAQGQGKAGLYMNPMAVRFAGYGKEIVNAPSGDQMFGSSMPPLPPGASAIPLSPTPGQMIVPPAGTQSMPGAPQYPAPGAYPSNPAPQPHYGVVPPAFQPPPGGVPMTPPAAPAYPQPTGMPAVPR